LIFSLRARLRFTWRRAWFIFSGMVFTRRNLDWWCERGILSLVLAALVFAPLAFGAVYAWSFLVVQALVIGVLVLWVGRLWGGHKPKLLWPPLAWAVAAFVLYAVARYLTADIEYVARLELIRILLYAFLFLAVVNNLHGQDAAETISYTLTAVAALASSYAVAQFLNHSNQVWNLISPYPGRASGTYICPNHFAGLLELVLPLPLAFLLAGRVSVVTRIVLAYAALTIAAGLAVTFSRGGWVAAAAGIFMLLGFLLCHRNHRGRAVLVLVLVLAGGGLAATHYLSSSVGYMRRVASPDAEGPGVTMSADERLQMWGPAVQMWRDNFWGGTGPGHYDYRFREYRPELIQVRPDHAHNDYLELFADWGMAGGVIVFGGVGIFIFGLVKTWPHVRREENDFGTGMSSRYAFYLGAVSGLFALAVHSLVDFNLHIPANALAGVTVLALVASNLRFATERHWLRARLPLRLTLTGVLGVAVVYLGMQEWRRGGETYWQAQAEKLPNFSTERAAALQKALACEPQNFQTAYDIGECFRTQSLDGGSDYAALAQSALGFYAQGIRLNPHDAYSPLRSGMCLDWLGRHTDAEKFYNAAEVRDPNGNYVVANIGWHFVQTGDYAAARQWFTRAIKLANSQNDMAKNYLYEICEPKLIEKASGRLPSRLLFYNGKDN
jgi:O-antigen ligase